MVDAPLLKENLWQNIPSVLSAKPRWVNWRYVDRDGKRTKPPFNARTGELASSTNPATWSTFPEALTALKHGDYEGIGLTVTDDDTLVGIDLDHCRNPDTGAIDRKAQLIVDQLRTYTEISPSGTGLRLWVFGAVPDELRKRKGHVEIYRTGRYLTVTGNRIGPRRTVETRQSELDAFMAEQFPPEVNGHAARPAQPVTMDDTALLDKMFAATNGVAVRDLWHGNISAHPSHSEADAALVAHLAFWTGRDRARMDRLFRQSGLMREKWDSARGKSTYGEEELARACANCTECYTPRAQPATPTNTTNRMEHEHMNAEPNTDAPHAEEAQADPADWLPLQPLAEVLLPVMPFSPDLLPAGFRSWATDVAERMACPLDFPAAVLVVATSSVIGAGCAIAPKQFDDWDVIPNLWGGLVGRSGMMKSPAQSAAMKPLEACVAAAKQQHRLAEKTHLANCEIHKAKRESILAQIKQAVRGKGAPSLDCLKEELMTLPDPTPWTERRYLTNDATIEKLAELQATNPRGLLVVRDELMGTLTMWEREGHEADRAFFLEAWNGNRSHTSDRIGRGTLCVENLCLSVFGGIQPDKLVSYLHAMLKGAGNDGLLQRFQVLVYPDEPALRPLIDRVPDREAQRDAYQVVTRLAGMDFAQYATVADPDTRPLFHFDLDAQAVVSEWLVALDARIRAEPKPVLQEHFSKYRSLMPSLALQFHLIELAATGQAPSPTRVSHACATQAIRWCAYLETHAHRIYHLVLDLSMTSAIHLSRKILEKRLASPFTVRDVYVHDWRFLDHKDLVRDACEALVQKGWLRERTTRPSFQQRGKTEFEVNPAVSLLEDTP